MPDQPAPRRAYHAQISVGGDTLADLVDALREIADRFESENLLNAASGSPSWGYTVEFDYDPDMTHDRYITLTRAWLPARRAGEATR